RIWRDSQKINSLLSKTGKLVTFSTIYSAPEGFEHQVPYHVGIVKLEDSEAITCQIVDIQKENLKIGLKVQTTVRRIGMSRPEELIEYAIKVKPL
ncbi:MAG TPA: OB-fold domain-containing protein, partial [Candidatus Saccharimonadales bacterium]|nr:OB-fold domain-containing protein [Candidatus Saccharimonadales bacterium]